MIRRALTPQRRRRIKAFVARGLELDGHLVTPRLPHRILIGTHHKPGTVWLQSIFKAICAQYSLRFFSGTQDRLPADWQVFFDHGSDFDLARVPVPFRGLHMIRDPRDVIVSGCFYHQTSRERWLHEPRATLGGRTYQEVINGYSRLEDRMLFEMDQAGAVTIDRMSRWDYSHPCFFELRYEDLIADVDLMLFHRAFVFLGFPPAMLPTLLEIAYGESLFSERRHRSDHIRSGDAHQWPPYFTRRLRERFQQRFGDVLVRLGYEPDDTWVEKADHLTRPTPPP